MRIGLNGSKPDPKQVLKRFDEMIAMLPKDRAAIVRQAKADYIKRELGLTPEAKQRIWDRIMARLRGDQ